MLEYKFHESGGLCFVTAVPSLRRTVPDKYLSECLHFPFSSASIHTTPLKILFIKSRVPSQLPDTIAYFQSCPFRPSCSIWDAWTLAFGNSGVLYWLYFYLPERSFSIFFMEDVSFLCAQPLVSKKTKASKQKVLGALLSRLKISGSVHSSRWFINLCIFKTSVSYFTF